MTAHGRSLERGYGKPYVYVEKRHRYRLSRCAWLKGICGSGGSAPFILNLGIRVEVNGQYHAPAALHPRQEPQYALNSRLDVVV